MSDYWFLAIDSSANILYQKTVGGMQTDALHTMSFTSSNSILLAGSSTSPVSGEKTLAPFGTEDLWFVHAAISVGVEENSASNAYKVYPNSTNNNVYIQNEKSENIKMELYDVTGRLILETENIKKSTLTEINLSLINKGYYVLRLTDSENVTTSYKLIKQ